jgi:hypothetical protein
MNVPARNNSSRKTVATVTDLTTYLKKCKAWLATRDGQSNITKNMNVLIEAIHAGRSDICRLIFDRERLNHITTALINQQAIACLCYSGHRSVAQLIIRRCHPTTQQLYTALANASTYGRMEVVAWLASEMQLSDDDVVRWVLTTASARGDIDNVKLLTVGLQTGPTSTRTVSQALKGACYMGKMKVVNWLTIYTAADVTLRGELDYAIGSMTSLTAACYKSHSDIVRTLLQCVTPHTVNIQCGRPNESALHSVMYYIKHDNWNHSLHSVCKRADIRDVNNALYDTDIDMIDHHGSTPLHRACQNGNVNMVQLLLSVFARDDITDNEKLTPIEIAKCFGNKELVSYMSQLLDVTNYTLSSSTGATAGVRNRPRVTRPTVDDIVSDASVVRQIVQSFAQRDAAIHRQRKRRLVKAAASKRIAQ